MTSARPQHRPAPNLFGKFEDLEKSLHALKERNGALRQHAQHQKRRLLMESRPPHEMLRDLNTFKKQLGAIQTKNKQQTQKVKKQNSELVTLNQDCLCLKGELDAVRKACVLLQRENIGLTDNPAIVEMRHKLNTMDRTYTDIVQGVEKTHQAQEGRIDELRPQLAELHSQALVLWETTSEIAANREEAARLIHIGNSRIAGLQEIIAKLRDLNESAETTLAMHKEEHKKAVEAQEKRIANAKDMWKTYCRLLGELRCQNESLRTRYQTADEEAKTLRAEQESLLESLMAYLLVCQDAGRISSVPATEILKPLCTKAGMIRATQPPEPAPGMTDDDEWVPRETPLHLRPYPSPDAQEFEDPEDKAPEPLFPLGKDVPQLGRPLPSSISIHL